MSALKILTGENNPILRSKSSKITKIDSGLKKLAKEMETLMHESEGLGLAAPQIGQNIRLFLMVLNYNKANSRTIVAINPEIISVSKDTDIKEEGCLSIPGVFLDVPRYKKIFVEYTDLRGDKQSLALENLDAREFQHELDHLDGILFTDRATNIQQKSFQAHTKK